MRNKKIYNPGTKNDSIIDMIRQAGGTIFVDPAPFPKPIGGLWDLIDKIVYRKL